MAKTKGVSIRDLGENLKGINFEIFGGIDGFLAMTSGTGDSDITQAQQLRRVVPWLAKAVDMTANAVSALPFAILRENGEPYDTSADWKNKTGGLESPESLFYLLASSLCFGRAYLIPQLTSRAIVDMQFVAPQTVRAEITRDGLKWFDRTTDKGAVSRYYPIESELDPVMVYFWLPDSDVEIGPALTHPAGNALLSARLLFNMDGTIATYAERGFIPPTVLGAKGMPGPAEREKAERWWDRFFRGKTDIAAKIINTEALSVVKVGAGMEDIRGAYPELTKQMIENIATAFGIPSGLFMSDMAFATEIKHLIKIWYTTSAFVKVYKAIETGFNEQVLKPWGLKLKFDPNAIDAMQEEEMERATAFSTYVNAGMRPSVAAEMLGIELPQGVKFADLDADMAAKQQREQLLAEAQAARFQPQEKEEKPDEEQEKPTEDKPAEERVREERKAADPLTLTSEQIKELNLWRQIAERNFRKGKGACADFEVKALDESIASTVRAKLLLARDVDDVTAAFEVGNEKGYMKELDIQRMIDNDGLKALADAINRATDTEIKATDKYGKEGHWVTINGDHVFIDENGVPQNAPYLSDDDDVPQKRKIYQPTEKQEEKWAKFEPKEMPTDEEFKERWKKAHGGKEAGWGMMKRDWILSNMKETREYQMGLWQGRVDKANAIPYVEKTDVTTYNLGYYRGYTDYESDRRGWTEEMRRKFDEQYVIETIKP